MLDRKLLVEALRVDNSDVLPKFGVASSRSIMEAATEYISIDDIMDYEEGTVTEDGLFSLMDLLSRGSAGIADSDGQPALSFMKSGSEIYAHNMFTDEDDVLDATPEALQEYIVDQMDTSTFEAATENATNVIFFREPNEYTGEVDILAAFIDEIEQSGDEGRILVYGHEGQHGYADPFYLEGLEEATPEEYEPLKQELEQQGYQLNVLNGIQDESVSEAANNFKSFKDAKRAIALAKRKLQKKLDKGDFYENFGQDELREIRNRVPSYAEDMNQDEFNKIQKEVSEFGEWCSTASPKKESVNEEDLKNYAVIVAKDIGNDYDLVEFREGFHSYAEAQKELQSIEDNLEEDPTLVAFIAYSDGMSWFDADTGEELDVEHSEEPVSEDQSFVVKQHNKADSGKDPITEYRCNTMAEVRKIFKSSYELNQIDKIEVYKGDKLYATGVPKAPAGDEKRWSVDWKKEATSKAVLNEDYSIDSALAHLDEEINSAKAVLDKIQQRVVYRMKDNISYTGDEAIDKVLQVADKISQDSSALHELVYNDIIG